MLTKTRVLFSMFLLQRKSKRKQRKMTQLMVRETQVDSCQEETESFKLQNLVTVVHLLSPFLNVRRVLALGWSVLDLPGYLFLKEWEDVKGLQRGWKVQY
ncbi:unnamed protein product [Brassica rapa subsp. trilocularis]